jgi:hypothetical protein
VGASPRAANQPPKTTRVGTPLLERGFGHRDGDWRLVATAANRMPAAASYLRHPGDTEFRAFKLDVLRIEDALIVEITTFGAALFPAFELPPTLCRAH